MTKKLSEAFNLPESDPIISEFNNVNLPVEPPATKEELFHQATEIYSALTSAEKIENALPTVVGLELHDTEMDELATKAIRTFDDLVNLGSNVPDMHAGKIFEVAGQMLKTALEAKNAKAEKKLRMIELQLKKARLDQIDLENGNVQKPSKGGEFDRNELLRMFVTNKDSNTSQNNDK